MLFRASDNTCLSSSDHCKHSTSSSLVSRLATVSLSLHN